MADDKIIRPILDPRTFDLQGMDRRILELERANEALKVSLTSALRDHRERCVDCQRALEDPQPLQVRTPEYDIIKTSLAPAWVLIPLVIVMALIMVAVGL